MNRYTISKQTTTEYGPIIYDYVREEITVVYYVVYDLKRKLIVAEFRDSSLAEMQCQYLNSKQGILKTIKEGICDFQTKRNNGLKND